MTVPTFTSHRAEWSYLPVDDQGYLPADELLRLPADELVALVDQVKATRYNPAGYRNWQGRWRSTLRLDSTHGARVLDYGCGLGVEALQYAKAGNQVWLADLNRDAVLLAERVLRLYGYDAAGTSVIDETPPLIWFPHRPYDFDVVHMAGVLHHCWEPRVPVEQAHRWLRPGGQLRLMVYSDRGWTVATGHPTPPDDITSDPQRERFVRFMDSVGAWADWYSPARLTERFGDLFTVTDAAYLAPDGRFLAAVLRRNDMEGAWERPSRR